MTERLLFSTAFYWPSCGC